MGSLRSKALLSLAQVHNLVELGYSDTQSVQLQAMAPLQRLHNPLQLRQLVVQAQQAARMHKQYLPACPLRWVSPHLLE